ncbi:MAG: hypothetical protein O6932_06405 [Gammaproteobacteria bacterium]|nr:hypothetical protein [Gammaproteobacteria bacterium]
MQEVPEHAEVLINPFKSQGAADVTDVGIVVRGKFTTIPGGQWQIRKEVYARVQKAFAENGIEFARKEVRVQLSENQNPANLTNDQKQLFLPRPVRQQSLIHWKRLKFDLVVEFSRGYKQ